VARTSPAASEGAAGAGGGGGGEAGGGERLWPWLWCGDDGLVRAPRMLGGRSVSRASTSAAFLVLVVAAIVVAIARAASIFAPCFG